MEAIYTQLQSQSLQIRVSYHPISTSNQRFEITIRNLMMTIHGEIENILQCPTRKGVVILSSLRNSATDMMFVPIISDM